MLKVVGASWVQTRVSWCLLVSISLLGLVALYLGPSYRLVYLFKDERMLFTIRSKGLQPTSIRIPTYLLNIFVLFVVF